MGFLEIPMKGASMFIRNRKIQSLILLACAAAVTAQPASLAAQEPYRPSAPAKNTNTLPLRFTNADMSEFAGTMADLLGLKPMIVDPAVQGTIEFSGSIPRDDIFPLFNVILKTKNAALVKQDNIYQIVPISSAIRNNLEIIEEPPAPGADEPFTEISPVRPATRPERAPEESRAFPVATHVIRLDFMPVDDIGDVVRLLASDGVNIMTFKRLNMIIMTDYSDNVARIREIVRMLDNSLLDPDKVALVKIEHNNALNIAEELGIIFGSDAAGGGRAAAGPGNAAGVASASATGISFVPLERLNAIFVMAASKRGLDTAKRWIEELDTYDGNKYQTYVYTVKDSTASNIAMMLSAMYGEDGSNSQATGSAGRNTRGQANSNSRTGSSNSLLNQALNSLTGEGNSSFGSAAGLGPRLNASEPTISSITLRGGNFSSLRDEARVVVDDINNALYIQSTLADYRSLLSTIEKMDVPPMQVLIDAQVFEVDMNHELTYGFRGALEGLTEGNMTTTGLSGGGDAIQGLLSAQTFVRAGSSRQIRLAIDALKTKTKVKILEQPSLLAMDGKLAAISSGAEVPYPGDTIITGNSIGTTGMKYRETGVNLQVIPKISSSGSVMMEITQEVSTVSQQTVAGLAAPIFPATKVTTTLSVKDGDTMVIAGLMRDSDSFGRGGVPFLSDIPFIGGLFGGTLNTKKRTELIILITPHVIYNQEKSQELTQELRDSLRNVRKFMDEYENGRVRDIEDARQDREKKELKNIREIKPSKSK